MNTLGLGRQVNTFGLGSPYGGSITPPPVVTVPPVHGGGGSLSDGHIRHGLRDNRISYRDELRQQQLDKIIREDQEMIEFIMAIVTKGLI